MIVYLEKKNKIVYLEKDNHSSVVMSSMSNFKLWNSFTVESLSKWNQTLS